MHGPRIALLRYAITRRSRATTCCSAPSSATCCRFASKRASRRRHRRGQGRLSESRPDGLRQPLRHGLLFRPGLYRLRADPPGDADRDGLAQTRFGKAFDALPPEQQAAVRDAMRQQLQRVDLTRQRSSSRTPWPAPSPTLRTEMAGEVSAQVDLVTGWTPAYSLDETEAPHTADFLIYSALTTVARRPGVSWSWTENWPYEPEVGNTPTTNTFIWTWVSFCFTFLCFGLVLFIYQFWLNHPDDAPLDPVLAAVRAAYRRASARSASISWSSPPCCCCRSSPARSWRTPTTTGAASTGSTCMRSCRSTSCATCTSRRRSSGSVSAGSAPACFWPGDRRRAGGARPGLARRRAVLGDPCHRRGRADRQLARHHGLIYKAAGSGSATRGSPTSSSAGSGRSASSSAC